MRLATRGSKPGGKTRFLVGVKNRLMPLELVANVLPALSKKTPLSQKGVYFDHEIMIPAILGIRNPAKMDLAAKESKLPTWATQVA
jgi:hypothetical protein